MLRSDLFRPRTRTINTSDEPYTASDIHRLLVTQTAHLVAKRTSISPTALLASCSSGWIEPPAHPALDAHCILRSIAEPQRTFRSPRLTSSSAASIELQRTAQTMAFDRAQRRTSPDRGLQHKEGDHALMISTCPAAPKPIMNMRNACVAGKKTVAQWHHANMLLAMLNRLSSLYPKPPTRISALSPL